MTTYTASGCVALPEFLIINMLIWVRSPDERACKSASIQERGPPFPGMIRKDKLVWSCDPRVLGPENPLHTIAGCMAIGDWPNFLDRSPPRWCGDASWGALECSDKITTMKKNHSRTSVTKQNKEHRIVWMYVQINHCKFEKVARRKLWKF